MWTGSRINDTYGHPVGDLAISAVAEAVQRCVRKEDVLLRWGGDEFIGILTGFDEEDAIPFAHKLRDAVSDVEIDAGAEPSGRPYRLVFLFYA